MSRGTVCGLNFFLSFESLRIFCRNLRHGSQTSIFVSRVKVPEELYFYSSFQSLFGFWAKIFPDFWPENFKKFSKLSSKCPEEQFVAWNLFLKNWIVLDFLQKTLQWFSNIYLRVQSKKSGRIFFFFSSDFFRILREKKFRFLAKKLQEVVKTNFCVSRRTIFGLIFFSSVLNRFGFSAETFGMVLKVLSTCPE